MAIHICARNSHKESVTFKIIDRKLSMHSKKQSLINLPGHLQLGLLVVFLSLFL